MVKQAARPHDERSGATQPAARRQPVFGLWKRLVSLPHLPTVVAILAGCIYLVQSLIFLNSQRSMLDEGAYLYQGLLFAKGLYRPFQNYGLWQYNAPLSYIIPGTIQAWFGPGLLTGRLFALVLGLLILLGVWIAARRLGGKWWAAAAVAILALNPANIKIYSLANSQVLVACMLTWVLVLVLGEGRPTWQLAAGSVLASLTVMTRHNMVPFLPVLYVYFFLKYGRQTGLWATLAGVIVLGILHALYWPNILAMWTPWLPEKLIPFLDFVRPPLDGTAQMGGSSWSSRWLALFQGIGFNAVILVGSLAALIFWPKKSAWEHRSRWLDALFLAVTFFILLVFHGLASLASNVRVYNFTPYLAFFNVTGLLFIVSSFPVWQKDRSTIRSLLAGLLILVLFPGLGYADFQLFGYALKDSFFSILNLPLPRIRDFFHTWQLTAGTTTLRDILVNKFHLHLDPYQDIDLYRRLLPVIAGLLLGLAFLLVVRIIQRQVQKKHPGTTGFGYICLSGLLGLSFLLAPTRILGAGYNTYDCRPNVIQGYAAAGHYLARVIPEGSSVYWQSADGVAPLLYLPTIKVLPGQIFGQWSLSPSTDSDKVLKFGLWNQQIGTAWAAQADFILIEERLYDSSWDDYFSTHPGYRELPASPDAIACIGRSDFRIFKKTP